MKGTLLFLALLAASAAQAQQAKKPDPDFLGGRDVQQVTGEQIFTHICQGCHMLDAKGATGAGRYPALASNPKLASSAYPAVMVMNGRGGMPPFSMLLDDKQIAAVVNYVRTHFGNAYTDTLTADAVKAFRPPPPPTDTKEH